MKKPTMTSPDMSGESRRARDAIRCNKLYRPALLAGLGVVLSTIASAVSLYLPPNV
jgi:hypothetical protein